MALCSGAKGVDNPRIRNARMFQSSRPWSSTSLVAMTHNVPHFMFPLYPMLLFATYAFLLFSFVLIVLPFRSRLGTCGLGPSPYNPPFALSRSPIQLSSSHGSCPTLHVPFIRLVVLVFYSTTQCSMCCALSTPLFPFPLFPLCSPVSPSSPCAPFAIGPLLLP